MEIFERLKKEILHQLAKKIAQLDDKALASGNIASKLHEQFKIDAPVLPDDQDKTQVEIGKEKVAFYDKPKGFSPGQTVDFALYAMPIEGSYDLFIQILKNYPWSEHIFHSDGKVFFKVISPVEIIGNSQVIEKIRLKALAKFGEIRGLLEIFELEADDFNTNEMSEVRIKNMIAQEQAKRAAKKSTEEQLNPSPV